MKPRYERYVPCYHRPFWNPSDDALKHAYTSKSVARGRAAQELCSIWQTHMQDPSWPKERWKACIPQRGIWSDGSKQGSYILDSPTRNPFGCIFLCEFADQQVPSPGVVLVAEPSSVLPFVVPVVSSCFIVFSVVSDPKLRMGCRVLFDLSPRNAALQREFGEAACVHSVLDLNQPRASTRGLSDVWSSPASYRRREGFGCSKCGLLLSRMCENPDAEVSSALRPATERAVCHGADGAVWRRDSEFVTERRLYREEIHRLRKHFQAAEQQKKEAQQKNVRRQPTRLGDVCWISLTPRAAGRGGDEDSCGRQGGEKGCEGGAISCEPGDAPLSLPVGD